jgi:hypothetical protein
MDVDTSKEEEGMARVVDHARDLCAWARVDDAEFKAVEGDGGGVKRGVTAGHGGHMHTSTYTQAHTQFSHMHTSTYTMQLKFTYRSAYI